MILRLYVYKILSRIYIDHDDVQREGEEMQGIGQVRRGKEFGRGKEKEKGVHRGCALVARKKKKKKKGRPVVV
jgi:hypothetical protein